MSQNDRPLRSVLYMPGSNRSAIKKSQGLDIDAVIIDLEDAIAFDQKETTRLVLAEEIQQGNFGWRQVVVRVNGLGTPWFEDDLTAIGGLRLDAVLFPKINSAADVHAAAEAMATAAYCFRKSILRPMFMQRLKRWLRPASPLRSTYGQ